MARGSTVIRPIGDVQGPYDDVIGLAALRALPDPLLVLGADGRILFVNARGEEFFGISAGMLMGTPLPAIIPEDSPIHALVEQARRGAITVAEYGLSLETPRVSARDLAVQATRVPETPSHILLSFRGRSIAETLMQQESRRLAARPVVAMAGMLAHEIRNPLVGIRGAAQLLEETAAEADKQLTRLICDESDRISALISQVEAFLDDRPFDKEAVNLNEVLDHVRRAAQAGFGRHVSFVESYDPSLPPALANRDQLIQVFMNLVKNAAQAVPPEGGEITLGTAYRHGVKLALAGSGAQVHLPLTVTISDNGPGIPEAVAEHLFEPFVTSKKDGKGLGLSLVAKIIGEHGGMIDYDSGAGRTNFRVSLPRHEGRDE